MLALFGIDVGDLVGDAIRKLVDLLVPDFAAGWAVSLVTAIVAVPDLTGSGFRHVGALRTQLLGVGFALLALCVVAGGMQVWLAGVTSGGLRAGELLRRAVIAAGALAVLPTVLKAGIVGTNLATAQLVNSSQVQEGLDTAFGGAFAFAAFTKGLSLGLALPAAVAIAFFTVALLVMKAGLTALLAVLVLASPLVLGLSPLPGAGWLVRAWAGGLISALLIPVAWALVFSVAALLAGDALLFAGGGGPFAALAKPLAAVACFWIAYRTPGFLLAAARGIGIHPTTVMAAARGPLTGRNRGPGGGRRGGGSAGRGTRTGHHSRFGTLLQRTAPATTGVPASRTGKPRVPAPRPAAGSSPRTAAAGNRTAGAAGAPRGAHASAPIGTAATARSARPSAPADHGFAVRAGRARPVQRRPDAARPQQTPLGPRSSRPPAAGERPRPLRSALRPAPPRGPLAPRAAAGRPTAARTTPRPPRPRPAVPAAPPPRADRPPASKRPRTPAGKAG